MDISHIPVYFADIHDTISNFKKTSVECFFFSPRDSTRFRGNTRRAPTSITCAILTPKKYEQTSTVYHGFFQQLNGRQQTN